MHIDRRHYLSVLFVLTVIVGCERNYPLSQLEETVAEVKLVGPWKLVATYDYRDSSGANKTAPAADELSILNVMKALEDNVFIIGFTEFHKLNDLEIPAINGGRDTVGLSPSVKVDIST